jgi:hypothetical protein
VFGRRKPAARSVGADVLAEVLENAGLWEDLPDAERQRRKNAVATGGWPFEGLEHREFFVDGEDLAEYGVENFLVSVDAPLKARGVEITCVRRSGDPTSDDVYAVDINGTAVQVWDSIDDPLMWLTATTRPIAVVNQLLAAAGSKDQMLVLYAGGNEGIGYFAPPAVAAAIRESGLFPEKEWPLVPG